MATATATHDDDLLIIADDDSSNDNSGDIEFSFDVDEKSDSVKTEKAELETTETAPMLPNLDISIAPEIVEETVSEIKEEIVETPLTDATLDLGIDISDSTETNIEVKNEEVQETVTSSADVIADDFSFDLGVGEETQAQETAVVEEKTQEAVKEETTEVKQTPAIDTATELASDSHENLNDIIAATIAKLEARQEAIATDKAAKTDEEADIKEKIKELQAKVKGLEDDMSSLDNESDKITKNISELEKMKLDPVKEHNAKRIAKK